MTMSLLRPVGIGLLFVVLFAALSCRRPAKDDEPIANPVKAVGTDDSAKKPVFNFGDVQADSFDIRKYPQTGDGGLIYLKEMPNLRRLILDKAPITDKGMKTIGELTSVTYLALCETQVTDDGLAAIKDLSNLEVLRLDKLRITDAGLQHLKAFPKLKQLSLWRTLITDDGLAHLASLSALEHLSIDETRVSDEGIRHLYGLPQLRYLSKWKTKVTDAGVKEFKQNMPRVKVNP